MGKAASFAAGLLKGLGQGLMDQKDRDERAEDRAMRKESHDLEVKKATREEGDRRDLANASKPVTMEEGAGGMLKPDTADNRDVGLPGEPGAATGGLSAAGYRVEGKDYTDKPSADAAVTAANSPEARRTRQIAALEQSGKPAEAAALDSAGTQGKLAKVQLETHEHDLINKKWDERLATITTPDQLAQVLTGTPMVAGAQVSVIQAADGKVQLAATGPDGTQTLLHKPFKPEEMAGVMTAFSKSVTPAQKIQFMMHEAEKKQAQDNADRSFGLQRDQFGEQVRHTGVMEKQGAQQIGISGAHLGVAQAGQALAREKFDADLKNDPLRNVPGGVKLSVAGIDTSLKAIEAATLRPDWDPKSPAGSDVMARQAQLINQRNKLMAPYLPATATTKPAYPGGGNPPPAAAAGPAGSVVRAPGGGWVAAPAQGAAPASAAASIAPPASETSGPNQRAGTSPEQQAKAKEKAQKEEGQRLKDVQAVTAKATEVLKAPSQTEAYKVIGMPGFDALPTDLQAKLSGIATGRK